MYISNQIKSNIYFATHKAVQVKKKSIASKIANESLAIQPTFAIIRQTDRHKLKKVFIQKQDFKQNINQNVFQIR